MTPNNASSNAATDYMSQMADAADKWAVHAQNVATKIQQGSYTTADAAQDFGQCLAVGVEAWSSYVSMMSQCLSGGAITSVTSIPFAPDTAPTAPMGLTITSSLLEPNSGETVADADVTFSPSSLTPQVWAFQLTVPTAGLAGGVYYGTVTTVPDAGSNDAAQDIAVSILIP
jgi:hypothetical protein